MSACAQCGGRSYLLDARGPRAHARACACASPCPRCDGSGYTRQHHAATFSERVGPRQYEVMVQCTCRLLAGRVALYNAADIPGLYAGASLEEFSVSSPHQAVAEGLGRAREVATRFTLAYDKANPGRGFILSGPVGTGKTHLLAAALGHLALERGVGARYVEISLLYATIRNGFQAGKSGGEIIQPLSEVPVLAIDELGKGRGSAFEQETLDELIARRYNAGRTTLFATNYPLEPERRAVHTTGGPPPGYRATAQRAPQAGKDLELLRERVGERIYSRLCQMCEFVELPPQAQDYRRVISDRARASGR